MRSLRKEGLEGAGLGSAIDCGKCIGPGVVSFYNLVEAANLKHFAYGHRERADSKLGRGLLQLLGNKEYDAEACTADIGEVFEVQDEGGGFTFQEGFQGILELTSIAAVYTA